MKVYKACKHQSRNLLPRVKVIGASMKVSIITVAFKAAATIKATLHSVSEQNWPDIQHIIIDGASDDGTTDLVSRYQRSGGMFLSEPDNGLYDAMNKGIAAADGDIIGLLNADDVYADPNVIEAVVSAFQEYDVDAVIGDVGYFNAVAPDKIVRYYDSGHFRPSLLAWGRMPAHPAMFLTRSAYEMIGNYQTDYKIAADFEFVARAFVKHKLAYLHLPKMLVKMQLGGISTSGLHAKWIINKESVRGCRENGIYSNIAMIMSKYPLKLLELIR